MPNPQLAGFIHDSAGIPVTGPTVKINTFARNDTVTALSTTTTSATGYWTITETAANGEFPDIQISNGTEITRFKYDDKIALTRVDAQAYVVRNDSATSSFGITINPTTLTADRTFTLPDASGTIPVGDAWLTSSYAAEGKFPVTLYKTASESVTNSALTTDTHLLVALSSAAFYKVSLFYYGALSTTGGATMSWTVPTGANLSGQWLTHNNSVGSGGQIISATSSWGYASQDNNLAFTFNGWCETSATAGNIVPVFRQTTADGTATTFNKGSWITVQKMSS